MVARLLQLLILCACTQHHIAAKLSWSPISSLKPVPATSRNASTFSALDEVIMLPWQVSLLLRRLLPTAATLPPVSLPTSRYSSPPRTRRGNFLAACFQVFESALHQVRFPSYFTNLDCLLTPL